MSKVLILTDGKAGHENQSKAFALALGREYELAPVRFKSKFHKALSYLLDRIGVHVAKVDFRQRRIDFVPVRAGRRPRG